MAYMMNNTRLLETWYGNSKDAVSHSSSSNVAQEAYDTAVERFCQLLTHDDEKMLLARGTNGIDEILKILKECHLRYHDKRNSQKLRKWILRLTSKIHHYGNILDVFVQHHPEYTSLVWGVFKILLVGAQNHEAVFELLAKTLSRVADALPRLDFYTVLYPTDLMKAALADLYSYIIKFFIRAIEWFRENPFQHILHSITRPPELRYKDLLEDIEYQSRRLDQLAASGSQAEVRAIHSELADTRNAVIDMRKMMAEFQAINSSAAIDTNQRVADIQFSKIVASVSFSALGDHVQAYQNLVRLAKGGKRAEKQSMGSLCSSTILMAWSNSERSEAAAIKGSFRTRLAVRYFCVAVVEQLQQSGVTVLWAFNTLANGRENTEKTRISSVDILKHITLQALKAGRPHAFVHEKSLAVTCSQFHTATTVEEWFRIFECVLAQVSGPVFIIIDLQVLHTVSFEVEGFNWATALLSFFESLSQRGNKTIFKVLLFGYGPVISGQVTALHSTNRIVTVKPPRGAKHQRAVSIRGGPVKLKQSWVKRPNNVKAS